MLINIKAGSTPPQEEDAITLLLGCHERIRYFTRVALRMAEDPEVPAKGRSEAARAVLRYYTVALPLHEADENNSIHPRLRERIPPGYLAEANEAMVIQHREIDMLVAALIPMWQEIETGCAPRADFLEKLRKRTSELEQLWISHLQLEEENVVPAMRKYLSTSQLAQIESEMRARRQPEETQP